MKEIDSGLNELFAQFVVWGVMQGNGEALLGDLALMDEVLEGRYEESWVAAVAAVRRVADQAAVFEPGGVLARAFDAMAEAWMLEECRGWEP